MRQTNWHLMIPPQVGVVSLGFGPPGIGKTEGYAKGLAAGLRKALGYKTEEEFGYWPIIASQMLPEDFGGIPYVEGGMVRRARLSEFHADRPGLRVFDELGNTAPATQAAMLEEIRLANNPARHHFVMAFSNDALTGANHQGLAPVTINRMVVANCDKADMEGEWMDALKGYSLDPDAGANVSFDGCSAAHPPIVPDGWWIGKTEWTGFVHSFLIQHQEFAHRYPDAGQEEQAWPSPRSWMTLIDCLAAGDTVGASNDTMSKMAFGSVGKAAGSAFMSHVRELRATPPEEILNNVAGWRPNPSPGMDIAIVRSVVGYAARVRTNETWEKCLDLAERIFSAGKQEIAVLLWCRTYATCTDHFMANGRKRTSSEALGIQSVVTRRGGGR